jgi:hypothetical protein
MSGRGASRGYRRHHRETADGSQSDTIDRSALPIDLRARPSVDERLPLGSAQEAPAGFVALDLVAFVWPKAEEPLDPVSYRERMPGPVRVRAVVA